MAIDPNLIVIKPVNEIPVKDSPDADDQFLLYNGTELNKTPMSNIYNRVNNGINGVATQSNAPTPYTPEEYPDGLFERYLVHEPLTSPNSWSNIVVSAADLDVVNGVANNRVIIEVSNGVATKRMERVKGDTGASEIPDYNPDLSYVEKSSVVKDNYIWRVADGQTANVGDVPGVSSKWVSMSEILTNKTQSSTDVFTATQSGSGLDSSIFSGFGFLYGALKNFNRVTLPIWQRASTTDEVTKVYLRIREDNYQGTLLFDGFKDVSIPQGTSQDITFDFNLIENLTNKNIWVEFVCDGLTRLNYSNLTAQPYRYKTTGNGVTDFNTSSLAGGSNVNPMAISFKNVTTEITLIPELLTDVVEDGNEKPITSDGVFEAIQNYDSSLSNVIEEDYRIDNTTINGTKTINSQNNAIKGWGQLLGKLTNFNRVGYFFNAIDSATIPNQVRCVIRKTSNTGTIIFDETISVVLSLNTPKMVYFDLPDVFVNSDNSDIFVSFFANGAISLYGGLSDVDFDSSHTLRFTTGNLVDTVTTSSNVKYKLYVELLNGNYVKQVSQSEVERIKTEIIGFSNPDVLLTSKVWLYPTFQYNIFDKNVVVPNFGDNLENYRIDYSGSVGQQLKRGFRLNNAAASLNSTITLNLLKGRTVLSTKTQNILSPSTTNGNGVNRKVLDIGDSTIDGGDIHIPLKAIFDADAMDVTFIGTRGTTGLMHEGRGGWTVNDYYGYGRKLFTVNVSGLTTPPTTGAIYKQTAGNDFTVVEVNITAGTGYFKLEMANGSADLATNGTLTKQSGTGDATISYSGSTVDSSNPFYYATTGKFDLGHYLTTTGQTMANGDWIFFQLGINDMFNIVTLSDATTKANTIITQLNEMLANITAYNANIRVGIVVTIPAAGQDAFGANYTLGQTSEMYQRTGLVTLQKKLIEVYDTDAQRTANRYLVSAHLNLDTDYNFPSADVAVNSRNTKNVNMQNNGVHPDVNGNAQIADMYAGIIKYFG